MSWFARRRTRGRTGNVSGYSAASAASGVVVVVKVDWGWE